MTCLDPYLSMAATEAGLEPGLACCDRPRAFLLGYLFNAFNLAELQTRLEKVFGFGFERSVRKQMVADKAVMCEMKFALYQTVTARHRYRTLPELRRYALSVGLAERDLPLVTLVLNHSGLSAHFDQLRDAGFKSMTYERFSQEVATAIQANSKVLSGFAYVKLRFLRSHGVSLDDAVTDCESRAFEALLLQYPNISSREHFHNLYKMAFKQSGLKLIAHHTTQGRNVFDTDGQFRKDSLVVSTSEGEFSVLDIASEDHMSSGLTGGDSHTDEATMVIHQLLSSSELNDQDRKFLTFLAGDTDTQFERWMQDERHIQDVERVINGQTPRYRRLVMEYLSYPQTRLRKIQHLLTHVQPARPNPPIIMQPTVEQSMRRPQAQPVVSRPPFEFAKMAVPVRF